ncbi:MAG TPA: protein kinase [Pyrinomonadaceae bacterium]|nr:protein kinase [Pyrinomonadaceae bacterium]
MDQPDWARIQQIYDLALPLPSAERGAFVAKECRDNPALADEVNELLQAHESSGDLLDSALFEIGLRVISDSEDDLVGTIVDERYRIIQVLAEGGMGKLYLAEHSNIHDKLVVLKVLSQTLLPGLDAGERFKQEVKALTLVKHPNIVEVLDAGRLPDRRPYVVMEYIDGVTLRSLIPLGGMDRKYAGAILSDIGAALGHIHNQGIVHRDLKPENIMIQVFSDGTEVVKILDLGIAKVKDSMLTRVGHNLRIGTEAYMSPEQKHGGEITAASDIYAMAIIAYEMVNGKRPPAQPATPLRQGRLSRKAHKLILRGLSEDAAVRPQSGKQFGEELKNALTTRIPFIPSIPTIAIAIAIISFLSFGLYKYCNQSIVPLPRKGFDYWLIVQPMRDEKAYGDPYKSNGKDDTFESGAQFQLNVRSLESGFLYIFNEGPSGFRLLYPSHNGLGNTGANQTVQSEWITFTGPAGAENFWIVWSISPVNELSEQNLARVKEFLIKMNAEVDADVTNFTKARSEATVRANNNLVLTLAQFKHH